MVTLRGTVLVVVSTLSLALAAPAQGEIDVEDLRAGDNAKISYSNPSMAGNVVIVEIYADGETEYVLIELDANGEGESNWQVSEHWDHATFNAPDSGDITRWIEQN